MGRLTGTTLLQHKRPPVLHWLAGVVAAARTEKAKSEAIERRPNIIDVMVRQIARVDSAEERGRR